MSRKDRTPTGPTTACRTEPIGIEPAATWLTDPAILNEASRRRVAETVERVRREGKLPTRGRIVAGLSFAFWRALFDRKYDRLWVAQLHRAFPESVSRVEQVLGERSE
ncbi:MAG TPA: hypothetical protein VMD79_01885 [Solirubrobacteraceae bacterium]|nr:hypothetical protein [Solirubrobacteraceae bacterium]